MPSEATRRLGSRVPQALHAGDGLPHVQGRGTPGDAGVEAWRVCRLLPPEVLVRHLAMRVGQPPGSRLTCP